MENRKEEFLKIVCQSYLIVILAVLPLYYIPWNGYYKLGDTKYYLYRNVSLLCQGIALLAMCVFAVSSRWTGEHRIFARSLAEVVKKSVDKCRTHAVTTGGLPVRNLCVTLCNLQPLWQYRVERRAGMVHGSCHDLFDDRRFFTDGEVRR